MNRISDYSLEYILGRFEGIACGAEGLNDNIVNALLDTCEMLADYIEKQPKWVSNWNTITVPSGYMKNSPQTGTSVTVSPNTDITGATVVYKTQTTGTTVTEAYNHDNDVLFGCATACEVKP